MYGNPLGPQPKDVGFELPLFPYPEHGEVITGSFLEHGLHWTSGFHDHKPSAPACGFRKLLGEHTVDFLFQAWLRASRADDVQQRYLCATAAS